MKKELNVKELSKMICVSEGTVRSWILKPILGQVYDSKQVNYLNLREKLKSYCPDFETKFGFKIEDIVIVKVERTKREFLNELEISTLEIGTTIVMHNYSLKTTMTFKGVVYDEEEECYINIYRDEKGGYRAYSMEDLTKSNIKIELA